jgi:hypothetical protein
MKKSSDKPKARSTSEKKERAKRGTGGTGKETVAVKDSPRVHHLVVPDF